MNPCPCGYRSDPRRACSCTPPQVEKYLSKISGPLLDRIDLHVEVPAVPFTQLAEMPPGPTSADLRRKSLRRGAAVEAIRCARPASQRSDDSAAGAKVLPAQARVDVAAQSRDGRPGALRAAHDKVLRVARTIADLDGHDDIKPQNIAEAVGYRSLDRSVWAQDGPWKWLFDARRRMSWRSARLSRTTERVKSRWDPGLSSESRGHDPGHQSGSTVKPTRSSTARAVYRESRRRPA